MFKFKPYGPFEVPVKEGRVVASELNDFWKVVKEEHPGLQDAVGCYIFATYTRGTSRPWYVGKTERASFKREAFQPHKREQYQDALKGRKRGKSQIYLIARITDKGKFRIAGKGKNGVTSIGRLEELLIGACLLKNPKLVNKSTTKHLREIHLPGYMNETPGARSRGARELAGLLGTKSNAYQK